MVQSRVHGGQCKAGDHVTTRDIEVNFSTSVSLQFHCPYWTLDVPIK